MPGVIEIVGLIASVLDLAGLLRDLIIGIYNVASNSFGETTGCFRFVKYLTVVEDVLRPYMNPAWQEISAMRAIVEGVRVELQRAWNLVSDLLDTNVWVRILRPDRFAKDLEKSQAAIQSFLSLIPIAALTRTVQGAHEHNDGHEHNGNEDLDQAKAMALSLSFFEAEPREEKSRGESSQAGAMEALTISMPLAISSSSSSEASTEASFDEIDRAMEASLDEIDRAMEASLDEIDRAMEASFDEINRDMEALLENFL